MRYSVPCTVYAFIAAMGGSHIALLHVLSLDHCPEFDKSRAVVLFPSDTALECADLDPASIDRAFIIDSKWKKAKTLLEHPSLDGVRRVKLTQTKSSFWRFHTKGVSDEGICTIECIHAFLTSLRERMTDPRYTKPNCFDNLVSCVIESDQIFIFMILRTDGWFSP